MVAVSGPHVKVILGHSSHPQMAYSSDGQCCILAGEEIAAGGGEQE